MLIGICHVESNKLTYFTYLLNFSQHYDKDIDVVCNSSFAYFVRAAVALQERARLLQHLFYFIAHETTA